MLCSSFPLIIPNSSPPDLKNFIDKEWLVTNGLGGYASGTVLGLNARRHHGLFVPNLPSPRGRTLMIPYVGEQINAGEYKFDLGAWEYKDGSIEATGVSFLKEFRLDLQTPTWIFEFGDHILEKKIFMPYGHNSVYVSYRLLKGEGMTLKLRPYGACRKADSQLGYPHAWPFSVTFHEDRYELHAFEGAPIVRITLKPFRAAFTSEGSVVKNIFYRTEYQRGLDHAEQLYSPGYFSFELNNDEPIYFIATTEHWELLDSESPSKLFDKEVKRCKALISLCPDADQSPMKAQLALAADQFIVIPRTRNEQNNLLPAAEQTRTIIAGYHWFTDWGRDTMISLEGLTLVTGRHEEARAILQTFGHYVRNGLLPNHFPEGDRNALYNTVDATFWYFHAIDRYLQVTGDIELLELLFPTLESIIDWHIKGTDFGIHMDLTDGLISAAAEGYQLTWMDAKVDEWVVTPRRGKAVEIQALWFNALKLMEEWASRLGKPRGIYSELSQKVFSSFNEKFWCKDKGYLFDVIDGPQGKDDSLRPNQIFTISLRFPILSQELWREVIDVVEKELFTPYGLRTLSPHDKAYHGRYEGDRWNRDAAYHQGLVWTWLMGAFFDAVKKVDGREGKRKEFLQAMEAHLHDEGLGTISEIFDGNFPYEPRGCIAQAWSVAEVLRILPLRAQ